MVPLASIAEPVLPPDPKVKAARGSDAKPDETEPDAVPDEVPRRLLRQEDVGRHEPGAVADGELDGGADAALVVAAEVVVEPDDRDGLREPAPAAHEVEGEVARSDRDKGRREQDRVADRREAAAEEDEAEAVPPAVRQHGAGQRDDRGRDVDRDLHVLGPERRPAQLPEDGRGEEAGAVGRGHDAEVHEGAEPDLDVAEDALRGAFVPVVHGRVGRVGC